MTDAQSGEAPAALTTPDAGSRATGVEEPRRVTSIDREPRVHAEIVLYRLFDVGYEIHLDRACELLASSAPERPRPTRGEAQAIQIQNPPVNIHLGSESVMVGDSAHEVELSARLFDFGVISLRARIVTPPGIPWSRFVAFTSASAASGSRAWDFLGPARDRLLDRMRPAIERPDLSPVTEDYSVFRVFRFESPSGERLPAEALTEEQAARLLIDDQRPVSALARKELLSQRLSYFEDDLTILTWNEALVIEPIVGDSDVQYVLEFANAQLLELRYYDAQLDAELPRIYDEIADARRTFHLLGRRFSRLLVALQTRVADATEAVERVENSLKVTDDVFLARIYAAALDVFRSRTWRSGIDRKVAIVREAYAMLNAESQARRSEVLEITIILLILIEIVIAVLVR